MDEKSVRKNINSLCLDPALTKKKCDRKYKLCNSSFTCPAMSVSVCGYITTLATPFYIIKLIANSKLILKPSWFDNGEKYINIAALNCQVCFASSVAHIYLFPWMHPNSMSSMVSLILRLMDTWKNSNYQKMILSKKWNC